MMGIPKVCTMCEEPWNKHAADCPVALVPADRVYLQVPTERLQAAAREIVHRFRSAGISEFDERMRELEAAAEELML